MSSLTFKKSLSILAVASSLVTGSAVVAHAAPPISQQTQEIAEATVELKDFLTRYGVDESTQVMLFEKLNSGLLWDSMNGAEPLSTRYASSGEEIKVYGDGSIAVFSVALEDQALSYDTSLGAINPSAVSGCTRSGIHYAMYWKNCTASWDYGFIQYYMNFDYQNIRGSGSSITDYRRWRADSQFGAVSNVTATRDSPNQITVSGNWQAPGGWSSRTHINVLRSEGVLAKTLP